MKTAIRLTISPDIDIKEFIKSISLVDDSLISRDYFIQMITWFWEYAAISSSDFIRKNGIDFFCTNIITKRLFNFDLNFIQDGDRAIFTINKNAYSTPDQDNDIDIMTREYIAERLIEFAVSIDPQAKENKYLCYTVGELKKEGFSDIEIDYLKENICFVCNFIANSLLDGRDDKKEIIENIKDKYKIKYNKDK